MSKHVTRRQFLRTSVAAGTIALPYFVPGRVLGAERAVPPSEKIVMGAIGIGSMGYGHLRSFSARDDVRMAAVCDLRRKFRERSKRHVDQLYDNSDCVMYRDYRELLARSDIDAVYIATPDHWHVLPAIEAARNGKDVYLEKPIDVHVAAAQALREAVNQYGVVFQFGTQQRSGRNFRHACELVRNQRIGKLHTIIVGSVPGVALPNQPIQQAPDPDEFDYDFWLGPAPWTPYAHERAASRAEGSVGYWMHIHDYGLGSLSGAWGIHHVDIAQWGNDSDDTGPVEIEGTAEIPNDGLCDTPTSWWVEHTYANGVRMVHATRDKTVEQFPQFSSKKGCHYPGVGILFIGSDGWVIVSRGGIDASKGVRSLFSEAEKRDRTPSATRLPVSNDHRRNFLDCIKTRQRPVSPIEAAVRSDTVCHLEDIAIRLGRRLHWDPAQERFVKDDQANRLLTRPMRSPWQL
jgi:predicted dehydrogenase